jgi:Tol biopolymer transport system component
LREGIVAARSGDRKKTREIFEKIVELDENNEKGWFWLASVVESDEERRLYLGNVVTINPSNTRAQELLERLEAQAMGDVVEEDSGGGSSARSNNKSTAYIAIGAGGIGIVILLAIALLISGGGGDEEPTPTIDPLANITLTPTNSPEPLPTATATLTSTPSPTVTPSPTLTPTLSPPSSSLPGRLLVISGNYAGDFGETQPIAIYDFSASSDNALQIITASETYGQNPSFSPNRSRFVFAKDRTGASAMDMTISDIGETESIFLNTYWGNSLFFDDYTQAVWSPTNPAWIAFTAQLQGVAETVPAEQFTEGDGTDIFIVSVSGTPSDNPDAVAQLTLDDAAESDLTWHPNGEFIIYVADTPQSAIDDGSGIEGRLPADTPSGVDLWMVRTSNRERIPLTRDGNTTIESSPDVSPDGRFLIYTVENGLGSDIWIMTLTGDPFPSIAVATPIQTEETPSTEVTAETPLTPTIEASPTETVSTTLALYQSQLFIDLTSEDLRARWSPDGRYVAFSGNAQVTGNFDIFIYDTVTGMFSRLDIGNNQTYVSEWIE